MGGIRGCRKKPLDIETFFDNPYKSIFRCFIAPNKYIIRFYEYQNTCPETWQGWIDSVNKK